MLEQSVLTEKLEKIGDPEKRLMDSGHFNALEYPNEQQTTVSGQDIMEHYRKIEQTIPENDRWILKTLVDYIRSPIIVDNFSSETERNSWQKEEIYKHPEVNNLFESNKLRGNVTGQILSIIEIIKLEDWLNSDLINRFEELTMEYRGLSLDYPRYNTLEIEEKIALIQKITDLVKDVYQAVANKFATETLK
jgi:hypothetical protein